MISWSVGEYLILPIHFLYDQVYPVALRNILYTLYINKKVKMYISIFCHFDCMHYHFIPFYPTQ